MNNVKELVTGTIGVASTAVGTSLQTDEILRIVSLVITIIGIILTYIVMPLINHFKKANEDGKITKEEIKEGIDIATNGAQQVIEEIKKEK